VQNLVTLWANLGNRRRFIVIGATLAMFLAILGLARMADTPNMALLYAGLDPAAAGDVIAALDSRAVAHQVRGDAIYVDQAQRDSLRMSLAAQNLPAVGGQGYELLDSLSGFGTTSQMFDAAYGRAKEGELARTILAMPGVRSARVHVAQALTQPFRDAGHPTASVTVVTAAGTLGADQARALRHLVAAAISGMKPDDVAVIDSVAGLVPSDSDLAAPDASGQARAAEIRQNVERLLAARVGPGKAVVEVTVDVVTDREEVNEHTFDPQGKVAISTETQDKSGSSSGADGSVTVASNLPGGDAGPGSTRQNQTSEKQERTNYEVSESTRQVIRAPGAVRRVSVAVLVDQETVTAVDGQVTFQPRSEEELATLRELVASAVGLDDSRGDVLTLKSLPFGQGPVAGTQVDAGILARLGPVDLMSVLQLVVLATVTLVLGMFVIRPILTSARAAPRLAAGFPPLALSSGPSTVVPGPVLTGEIDDGGPLDPAQAFGDPDSRLAADADPVARLRRLIEVRQAESIEILRSWMEHDEEPA
jgi:flagellar M-ring protein FliF